MSNNQDAKALRIIFSKNLNRFMGETDENISSLSAALKIPFSTVADWVHGRKYPRMDKVQLLADYFGVPKSALTEEPSDTGHNNALSAEQKELIELFDAASPELQMAALAVLRAQKAQDTGKDTP